MRDLDTLIATYGRGLVRRFGRLAAGALVALLGYVPAAAADDGNWLYLEFQAKKAQAQVRLASDGVDVATQVLKRKSLFDCRLDTSGSLLSFAGSQAVGFSPFWHQGSIGVKRTSQGITCAHVRNNQFLTLQLGNDPQVAGQKVVEGTLSLVILWNVRIQIEARNEGAVVQKYEVRAGRYTKLPVPEGVIAFNCPSHWGRTCNIPLAPREGLRWDSLKLSTVSDRASEPGAWSIGGGTTKFKLLGFNPEGDLDCGDEDTEAGGSLRRLDDVDAEGAESCTKIPYQLDFNGQELAFTADYGVLAEGEEPTFSFDIDWQTEVVEGPVTPAVYEAGENPPSSNATFVQQVPFSVQSFGESPDADTYLLDLCPGQPVYQVDVNGDPVLDENGNRILVGLSLPEDFNDAVNGPNDMSDLSGFQFGCLVKRQVEILDFQVCADESEEPIVPAANLICVRVKESGYLRGDWTATRTLR